MRNIVVRATVGACLVSLLQACSDLVVGSHPVGEGAATAAGQGGLRGTGPGLSLQADAVASGGRGTFSVTLRNDGVERATRIQPPVRPAYVRLVKDECSGSSLPAAASCRYTLALEGSEPRAGTMALAVQYDYADLAGRSTGASIPRPQAPSVVAAATGG
jgi:hypothetical protein